MEDKGMKKGILVLMIVTLVLSLLGCTQPTETTTQSQSPSATVTTSSTDQSAAVSPSEKPIYTIASVDKLPACAWFQRYESGITKYGEDSGNNVIIKGPSKDDSAEQVQILNDVIAQGPDALVVCPLDPTACETALKKAREAGIVVIATEASTAENIDYDIEAFTPSGFGAAIMDNLAEAMNYEGQYITMVSQLTMSSHNEWADAGVAQQLAEYPDMELIQADARVESNGDSEVAYQVAKEMIKKYPDLKGIMGTSSFDCLGIARAIKELGKEGQIFTTGTGIPSEVSSLLKDDSLKSVALWDPMQSAYACCVLAEKILNGETVETGIDLGVEGYNSMTLDGKVLMGAGWIIITKENVDTFGF
jgi:simple sugar transport system substrate-binding protein